MYVTFCGTNQVFDGGTQISPFVTGGLADFAILTRGVLRFGQILIIKKLKYLK